MEDVRKSGIGRQNGARIAVRPEDTDTLVSDWVTLKILASPEISPGDKLSAVSLFFEPGQGHARHNHLEADQIIYMIAGRAEMMIEFAEGEPETQIIEAGELVYIPQGAFHSTFNVGWEPVRILAVYSPAAPAAGMRNSTEFTVIPAGEIAIPDKLRRR